MNSVYLLDEDSTNIVLFHDQEDTDKAKERY